jgi:hypothetical protein
LKIITVRGSAFPAADKKDGYQAPVADAAVADVGASKGV